MSEFEKTLSQAKRGFVFKLVVGFSVFICILAAVFFLLYYPRGVAVEVVPEEAKELAEYSISDGRAMFVSNKAILIGHQATAKISAPGYIPETVQLSTDRKFIEVELQPAPARIMLTTKPSLPDTQWLVNGNEVQVGGELELEVEPGMFVVDIDHPHYRVANLQLDLAKGETIERNVVLEPVNGKLKINSFPQGATVSLNGKALGKTPFEQAGLSGGTQNIELTLENHVSIRDTLAITNKNDDLVRDYIMEVQLAALEIDIKPPGGELIVNGKSAKPNTPITLAPGREHVVRYEKSGYVPASYRVSLAPGERKSVMMELAVETGQVTIRSNPPAALILNGQAAGNTPRTFDLQTVAQSAKLVRSGYRELEVRFTPDAKFPLLIDKTLVPEAEASIAEAKAQETGPAGIMLKLFNPNGARFTMGAPVSEPGQRANEFLRPTVLEKPFYVGVTEVTNAQYGKFAGGNSSNPKQPKTQIAWAEAARFCNWLSDQEKLERVYRLDSAGNVLGYNPKAIGYRLITEAEWEWLAKAAGRSRTSRFVWGNSLEIPQKSGNFADESAKRVVSRVIPDYNDGFSGVSPVASFPADVNGLHDLAGNVSEWVHDVYVLEPPEAGTVAVDPMGFQRGENYVVKGSNFRTARVSEMRSSFRNGGWEPREDVGFRVARYVYGGKQ